MEIDYTDRLPKQPPEGLTEWITQQGGLCRKYLIYKAGWIYEPLEDRKKPAVDVVCSACGNTFAAQKINAEGCHNAGWAAPFGWENWADERKDVISGMETTCPICGARAQTRHVSNVQKGIEDAAYTAQVCRVPVEGKPDRLAILEWRTSMWTEKDGTVSFYHHLWTAWVVEEKKIVRIMGYKKCLSTLSLCGPEQRKTYLDYFEKGQLLYPFSPSILEGTTGENCKLDLFIHAGGEWLVSYLALWRKRPAAENLVVQGYGKLVNDLIDTELRTYYHERKRGAPKLETVDWTQKKPNRMLHMSKEEFRRYAGELNAEQYKVFCWAREHAPTPPTGGMETLLSNSLYSAKTILEMAGAQEFWRCVKYLSVQGRNYTQLRDYWNMARALNMDLEDGQVKWPKNLHRAHDGAMKRYQSQKDELMEQNFTERREELEKFAWGADGILIRPCANQEELRREGKELHHCVATYAERHANGETAIFFIRRAAEPDRPWYTLELDEKKLVVRQDRGLRNCDRTPEIQAFESAWLAWLRAGKKKRKKKGANAA
jgi:hypothetical protein